MEPRLLVHNYEKRVEQIKIKIMGVHAYCPVALVKLGIGWIQVVYIDRSGQGQSRAFQAYHISHHYNSHSKMDNLNQGIGSISNVV